MVDERAFRQHLLNGYQINPPFMEQAHLRFTLLRLQTESFKSAVRRYQARHRAILNFEQQALAALKGPQ